MQTYYKIQNKSKPELFHKGGVLARWSTKGKVWTSISALRNFLTMAMRSGINDMSEWYVVEYEVRVYAVKNVAEIVKPERLMELLKT